MEKKIKIVTIDNKKNYTSKNTDNIPLNPSSCYDDLHEIEEDILKNYTKVSSKNIIHIPLGTRVKYVEPLNDGTFKVKIGGVLTINKAPTYLMLSENGKSWSVQLDKHIIYVEMTNQINKEYKRKIYELEKTNANLVSSNINLKDENDALKKELKSLKKYLNNSK